MQSPSEPKIVSRAEWLEARKQLLTEEKALTHERDRLAQKRRALPWVEITAPYVFERKRGKATLAELFDGRSQLLVYHLMFAPDWKAACKSCSFWADHFHGISEHLAHRDVQFAAISRAPLAKLTAFADRLGWRFEWVSSADTAFNYDFGVSFTPEQVASGAVPYNYGAWKSAGADMPGISAFARRGDRVFHTYSAFGRGIEPVNATYQWLDLAPKGRDEDGLPSPMSWVRLRDEYDR